MYRTMTVVAVIAVVAMLACGGNGSGGSGFGGGQRMTVEEYAAACVSLDQRFPDDEFELTGFSMLDDIVDEVKSWNPPEELAQFHEVYVRTLDAAFGIFRETGILDLLEDLAEAEQSEDSERMMELFADMAELESEMAGFEAEMAALEEEVSQAVRAISPETRAVVEDAGCTLLEGF